MDKYTLLQFVRESRMPPHVKAFACLGLMTATQAQIDQAAPLIEKLFVAAKANDTNGIAQVLSEAGLDAERVKDIFNQSGIGLAA